MNLIDRLKARKALSAHVEVDFCPTSQLFDYATAHGIERVDQLTPEQRKDAERTMSLVHLTFKRLSSVESRKWEVETLNQIRQALPTFEYCQFISQKLGEKFVSGYYKTRDTDDDQHPITAKDFAELCEMFSITELLDLANQYQTALAEDEKRACERPTQ